MLHPCRIEHTPLPFGRSPLPCLGGGPLRSTCVQSLVSPTWVFIICQHSMPNQLWHFHECEATQRITPVSQWSPKVQSVTCSVSVRRKRRQPTYLDSDKQRMKCHLRSIYLWSSQARTTGPSCSMHFKGRPFSRYLLRDSSACETSSTMPANSVSHHNRWFHGPGGGRTCPATHASHPPFHHTIAEWPSTPVSLETCSLPGPYMPDCSHILCHGTSNLASVRFSE